MPITNIKTLNLFLKYKGNYITQFFLSFGGGSRQLRILILKSIRYVCVLTMSIYNN